MSQSEGFEMKTFVNLVIFFTSLAMSLISAEEDFSGKNGPMIFQAAAGQMTDKPENSSAPKATERASKVPTLRQSSHQSPTPQLRHRTAAAPNFAFSPNPTQTIYLSDGTGEYDLRLRNFHGGQPTNFQAALGAISAHILNQRNGQEYIPYPPNGNPYNYPAYLGRADGAGAYERGTRSDDDVPWPMDVDHRAVSFGSFEGSSGHFSQEVPHPSPKAATPFYEYMSLSGRTAEPNFHRANF